MQGIQGMRVPASGGRMSRGAVAGCAALTLLGWLAAAPEGHDRQASARWLERLGSESAAERALAQRWLSTHLATDDYPELARAAERGDAEVQRRLLEALASDDRHLSLAALLLTEEREVLGGLGRRALRELALRWCPGVSASPAPRSAVLARLARTESRRHALAPAEEPLPESLDRLARLGGLSIPLAIAPELLGQPSRAHEALEGTASGILVQLTRAQGLSFAGVGDWSGEEPGRGAWIVVAAAPALRRSDGVAWLADWCRSVQQARGPDLRAAAAAQALGATGWPAAIAWLEERWLARRDPNALAGLLLAAERGRVAPGLTLPGERTRILALVDGALAAPGGEGATARAARALAALGAASPVGADPALELSAGFAQLSVPARWVRLVALEGVRSADSRVRELLRSVLLDPAPGLAELRLQALRTSALAPSEPGPAALPARIGELVDHALATGRERELAGLLAPSADAALAALLAGRFEVQGEGAARELFLLDLAYLAGSEELAPLLLRAAKRCERGLDSSAPLVQLVADWVARDGPGPPAGLLERAAARAEPAEQELLERIALLAGCLAPGRHVAFFEELERSAGLDRSELEFAGALAAGPRGGGARALLERALRGADAEDEGLEDLVSAIDRAVLELRRAHQDEELARFTRIVWSAISRNEHPLQSRLRPPAWPSPPALAPVLLHSLDREFPRAP